MKHNKGANPPEGDLDLRLIIVLSIGRSGSTFFARSFCRHTLYQNRGENRFFWQNLAMKPKAEHAKEIQDFFFNGDPPALLVLDKTPALFQHLNQIDFGDTHVDIVVLRRNADSIEKSRETFSKATVNPKRIRMRIAKYRRDYGSRWIIPVLQRWYYVFAVFGLFKKRTVAVDFFSKGVGEEIELFEKSIAEISKHRPVIPINYDNFSESAQNLSQLHLTPEQIRLIIADFTA